MQMGFDRASVTQTLQVTNMDVDAAIDILTR